MGKKLLKIQMQKQKETIEPKVTRTLRSKKIQRNSSQDKSIDDIESITKKIEILDIDGNETKDESIDMKKCLKKSISKNKATKKSQQKRKAKTQESQSSPQYQKLITVTCTLHSIKSQEDKIQLLHNDLVNFQWFNKISMIWGSSNDKKPQLLNNNKSEIIKKTQKITYLSEITSSMLKRLKLKHWLNDEVINSYIQLMQVDIIKENQSYDEKGQLKSHTVHLVQSYFATLKATTDKIQRQIKKRGFTQQSTIIIPINEDYHWFFVIISDKKIFICDSILPKNLSRKGTLQVLKKTYSMKQTFKKCFQLYEVLYKKQQFSLDDFHVITQFPQQDNQNDCGMMMLCGMKNIVTKLSTFKKLKQNEQQLENIVFSKDFWNFCQADIKFLRFLFTRQLLEEKILFY